MESERASEDVNNADEGRGIPLDGHCSVDLVVPEARTRDVKTAIGLLHDDAVSNKLEVAIDCSDTLENLNSFFGTSSQIWFVQTCASLTL